MSGTRSRTGTGTGTSIHKIVSLPEDCDPRNIFFIIGHGHEALPQSSTSPSGATKGTVPVNTTFIAASHCGLPVNTKLHVFRLFTRARDCALRAADGKSDYYESGKIIPNIYNSLVLDYISNETLPKLNIGDEHKKRIVVRTNIEIAKSGVYSVYNIPGFKAKTFTEYATSPSISEGDWEIQENDYKLDVKKHKVVFTWNLVMSGYGGGSEEGALTALEDHQRRVLEAMLGEAQKGSLIRGKYDIGFRRVLLGDGLTTMIKPHIIRKSSIPVQKIVETINKVRTKGSATADSPHLYVYYIGCRTFADPDIAKYTKKYANVFNTIFNYAIGTHRSFFLKTRADWNAMMKPMLTVADMFRYHSALEETKGSNGSNSSDAQAVIEKVLEFKQWLFADLPSRGAPLLLQMIRKLGDQYPEDHVLRVARTSIDKEEAAEFKAKLKVIQEASKI